MKKVLLGTLFTSIFIFGIPTAMAAKGQQPTPATRAYMQAMEQMRAPMMQGVQDPDPDVAFVKGMIPHHEGAIKMAQIELQYGKDGNIKKLAEKIIKAQKNEIVYMRKWLATHDK